MRKCLICGKEYIINENVHLLPKTLQETLKIVPQCDCEYAQAQLEQEKKINDKWLAEKREADSKRIARFKDVSIEDVKFYESTFENTERNQYVDFARRYVDKFLTKDNPIGVLFYGKVGTGKTHIVACIANELMKHKRTVMVLNISKYLSQLRNNFSEDEKELLKHVKQAELLILDDFGVSNMTPWVSEKIFTLIDTRYGSKKPMIITTNLKYSENIKENEISKKFQDEYGNDRIADRINEMCHPVHVKGESRRKADVDKLEEFLK